MEGYKKYQILLSAIVILTAILAFVYFNFYETNLNMNQKQNTDATPTAEFMKSLAPEIPLPSPTKEFMKSLAPKTPLEPPTSEFMRSLAPER